MAALEQGISVEWLRTSTGLELAAELGFFAFNAVPFRRRSAVAR